MLWEQPGPDPSLATAADQPPSPALLPAWGGWVLQWVGSCPRQPLQGSFSTVGASQLACLRAFSLPSLLWAF